MFTQPDRRLVRATAYLIAIQAASWAAVALPGSFQRDDLFYIEHANSTSLWDWLGRICWEHFAPGHRLVFWLLGEPSTSARILLELALLAAFAAGLVFLHRSLVLLFGRSWWLLVPVAATGFAWQFALGFSWPSAGLQVIPEFAFGSLCMYAFLRWIENRRWQWLGLSALAFTLGLAFYVRVLLVPVVLFVIRYLWLERSLRPRSLAHAFWEDRACWLSFLVPATLYLSYFWHQHAFESPPPQSAAEVLEYVRNAWARNVVPGFLGVRGSFDVADIAGEALVLVVVCVSFARKHAAALRAWAYVALTTGATFWLTARGKVGVAGPAAGLDPRYVANLCWQLPIGFVFALHPKRVLELGTPWPSAPPGRRARQPARAAVFACALAVVAAFAVRTGRSVDAEWEATGDVSRIDTVQR